MLDRIHGLIVFECDGPSCHEVLETETRDFAEAKELLDEEGWKTRCQNDNIWLHVCPTCTGIETENTLS